MKLCSSFAFSKQSLSQEKYGNQLHLVLSSRRLEIDSKNILGYPHGKVDKVDLVCSGSRLKLDDENV